MSTKKPTAAQLAARKKFAEAAKNGTLAKKRATASKSTTSKRYKVAYELILHDGKTRKEVTTISYATKQEAQAYANQLNRSASYKNAKVVPASKSLNTPLPKGMTKSVARAINVTGLRKSDGTLKKGFKYAPGGKIVKAAPKKK